MVGLGESSSFRRSSAEPVYRDNIQLKNASVNVSDDFDIKRDVDSGLPVYDNAEYEDVWGDTPQDQRDMLRMGKKQVRMEYAMMNLCLMCCRSSREISAS